MLELLGLELPRENIQHAILFFSALLTAMTALTAMGYPIGPALPPAMLNRDQEQLRYWLDEAQRPGADAAACLAVARIYWNRLGAGEVDRDLRLRYEVATSRQHRKGDPGGR